LGIKCSRESISVEITFSHSKHWDTSISFQYNTYNYTMPKSNFFHR
jgi:hypothetical protein